MLKYNIFNMKSEIYMIVLRLLPFPMSLSVYNVWLIVTYFLGHRGHFRQQSPFETENLRSSSDGLGHKFRHQWQVLSMVYERFGGLYSFCGSYMILQEHIFL